MNWIDTLSLFFVGQPAPPPAPPPGPSGAPSSLSVTTYAVGEPTDPQGIRVSWTNGDASAYTRIYIEDGGCGGTASLQHVANPGVTSVDLGTLRGTGAPAEQAGFRAKHYKNGQESAGSNCVAVNIGGSQA